MDPRDAGACCASNAAPDHNARLEPEAAALRAAAASSHLRALTRPQTPDPAAARPARFVSLRLRLLGLVMLVVSPWLALVLSTEAD